jgi:hypothetical protein
MKIKNLEDVLRHLPIKGEVAFGGGRRAKFSEKIKKQQLKALRTLVDDLKHLLEPGEEILLASPGASPFTAVEQLTTGMWIYHIKRCVLVLTDRRLLHILTDYKYKPRMAAAQVRFNDIESFKGKKRITFKYKNGTKEAFSQVRHGKRLVQLLKEMVGTISTSTQHAGRQHLCPRCVAPLARDRFTCPRCRLEFKEPGTARLYSIFLPGGGYFYTRHPWLGFGDAITELVLIFVTFVFLLEYFTVPVSSIETLYRGLFFGAILVVEKLITIYHAKHFIKEYIPAEKTFNRIAQTVDTRTSVVRDPSEAYDSMGDERVTFK